MNKIEKKHIKAEDIQRGDIVKLYINVFAEQIKGAPELFEVFSVDDYTQTITVYTTLDGYQQVGIWNIVAIYKPDENKDIYSLCWVKEGYEKAIRLGQGDLSCGE